MAAGSPGNPHRNQVQDLSGSEADMEKAIEDAFGTVSMEDLMAQSVSRPPEMPAQRPSRGGRPTSREIAADRPASPAANAPRRGKIIAMREGSAFVDIGGKSQGIVPLEQFDDLLEGPDPKPLEIGQEFDFIYKGYDQREGLVMLARQGAVSHAGLEQLREGDIVEAQVTAVNRGGLECRVNNARAFMPAGQVDTRFNESLEAFVGQRLKCQVMQLDRTTKNVVLSRRVLLEQEQQEQATRTWAELSVGQVREGVVRSVQPYGAFVDVGGVDGLLHISAMSHTRVSDPTKIVKPGDKIHVMILQMDPEKQRVSLGLKQLIKDPWQNAAADFAVGTTVTGTVTRVLDFGAFVELAPGVEGLVHVSQLASRRVSRPSEVVKEGQEVQAKVVSVDTDKKRIGLSMADAERDARAATAAPAGPAEGAAPRATPAAPTPAAPKAARPAKNLRGGL